MKNLMSADFYKIFKNKSLLACTILIIVFAIGTVILLDFSYKMMADNPDIQIAVNDELISENSSGVRSLELVQHDAYEMFSQSISGNISIFIAIIVSIFVGAEFGLGTIKNTATKSFSRTKIYLSKLFVSVIVSSVLFVLFAGLYMLTATLLWGFGTPPAGFGAMALKLFGLQLLLSTAFTSVFVTVAVLIRQSGTAIAVNLCITMQVSTLVFSLIDMLIHQIANTDFALSNYLLSTNVTALYTQEFTNSLAFRSLMVGICFIVVSTAIGIFSFNKRDIK